MAPELLAKTPSPQPSILVVLYTPDMRLGDMQPCSDGTALATPIEAPFFSIDLSPGGDITGRNLERLHYRSWVARHWAAVFDA